MTQIKKRPPSRNKEYRKIWENYHGKKIPKGMHIHHIDGDHTNNSPHNLMCVTAKEHFELHLQASDYGAAFLIYRNHLYDEDISISEISSNIMKSNHINYKKRFGEAAYKEWQRSRSLGKRRTDEQKENYRLGAKKRTQDPQFRFKLSAACKGKRQIKVCPHCGVSGGGGNMSRYHFDKCKSLINSDDTKPSSKTKK